MYKSEKEGTTNNQEKTLAKKDGTYHELLWEKAHPNNKKRRNKEELMK